MAKTHSTAALIVAGIFSGGSALFTGASFFLLQQGGESQPEAVLKGRALAPVVKVSSEEPDEQNKDRLQGLWSRFDQRPDGHPLRFYYFHGNGHGLYRYGKVGWTQTHSFDYRVKGSKLELKFRKRGQVHRTRFEISRKEGKPVLKLADDPREPGASYRYQAPPMHMEAWDPQSNELSSRDAKPRGPGNRLWMDFKNFATGGHEFSMYQFNAPAIDGRGVGWFHRGDFDDWTTESLQYRLQGQKLEMFFELNERFEVVPFALKAPANPKEDGKRVLRLKHDPRNFWLDTEYKDAGPSFGGHPAMAKVARMQHILATDADSGACTTW